MIISTYIFTLAFGGGKNYGCVEKIMGSKTSVQEYSDSNVLKGVCLMGFAGKSWQR
jgi:hypothetical protein